MKGILGRKLGMTQVFTIDGTLIPVTVIDVKPNVVLQKKTKENDGYEAVQLGYEDVKEHRSNKPAIGHAKKANTAPKHYIREVRADEMMNLEVGAEVKADLFKTGDVVDVQGVSKGHGFMGTIVRNNASRGPMSHGSGHHRHIGSLATNGRNNGVVNKGTVMPGHEGCYTTTNQNLTVIKADADEGYILVKGNVPGPKRGLVLIHTTVKPVKEVKVPELISYEGGSVEEELNKVENTINAELAEEEKAIEAAEAAKKAAASAARKGKK
ncbi:MAG: 50S ribosomal protein L3 [Lactimicrobium sp.]|jgi:large subunit ribosomal protein L3|uniref:Large ribosomal subunit protein uL3 n=1 Tax=Grylomicrobium aquisgranensis TaxID=2926318 RepID=A0AB35U6I1_9FIRM|nr:50S ribosomal protein L3 [Lactimicrobium massiliense]MDX8419596.1 50S ribosomal protein L3 [Stecheria sp. CLA-KB-P133]MDY3930957.1 50S ribosomal protein L3 [Erysipelotrichaceae bacterium]MDD6458021.1 50S ribosomal protein L3 [Lactimicrobium massiliense]MDD6560570.1 50S ribosomal protein L3 [Lactimicrobium massiliense]MEE1333174.1 50S ribosomal protein L3 [Erysipelotrichaceae bacterium]